MSVGDRGPFKAPHGGSLGGWVHDPGGRVPEGGVQRGVSLGFPVDARRPSLWADWEIQERSPTLDT